jgi:polysaccharide export outer membrane protein
MLIVIILLSFLSQTALAQTGLSQAPGDSGASGVEAASEAPAGSAPGEGAYPGFGIPAGQEGGPSEGVSGIEIGPEDIFPTQLGEEEAPPEIAPPPTEEEKAKTGALPERAGRLGRLGYDLFRRPPSTFAPIDQIPVGPDYVMGPGDKVRITIWGMVEGQWSAVIDRDGNLRLPRAGVINAAGLTFSQLQEAIRRAYSRYYTNFEINVTMGRLRSITVYVVGEARRPGTYSISSLSTLINALVASGGPSYTGTLRDIQVKRGDKTITHFDLYDFLLKGDKTKDVRLMPEDVIFIPRVGTVVGISGNVLRPAYYEVAPNTQATRPHRIGRRSCQYRFPRAGANRESREQNVPHRL